MNPIGGATCEKEGGPFSYNYPLHPHSPLKKILYYIWLNSPL